MLSDPIAALATPPGRSALAVIRLSGTGALELAERVVSGVGNRESGAGVLAGVPDRVATLVRFLGPDGRPFDQGLVTLFRAPRRSPGADAGEDGSAPPGRGGPRARAHLRAARLAGAARRAAPGKFPRRALLNGKLD